MKCSWIAVGLSAAMLYAGSAAAAETVTLADWRFEPQYAVGTIESGQLTLRDASGNHNDLTMRTYGEFAETARFTEETMDARTGGSIFLNGSGTNGIDFVTTDGAPINQNDFADGYTIEILYRLPSDWTVADRWTSLLSRLGTTDRIATEGETITTAISVSNCKEIQVCATDRTNSHRMASDAWSVSMDKGGAWYHIVVTSDGHALRTYVNGCEAFRDYVSDEMVGLYADPEDGRFRIANRVKDGVPYRFTRGHLQEIRISRGSLDKSEWLVQNPEQYLGEYGSNDAYSPAENGQYTFVFLPDIQNTNKFKPTLLRTAVQSLIDDRAATNLKAVVALGDLVQDYDDTTQWENAAETLNLLPKQNVNFLAMAGNHDYGGTFYLDHFGAQSQYGVLSRGVVTQDSPSGYSSYMLVPGGSYRYLILALDMLYCTDEKELAWMHEVLDAHSDCPTIVTSHDLQNCSPSAPSDVTLSANGTAVWNELKRHPQIFLLIGGHSHGSGEETLSNDAGLPVYSVLADYQFGYNGGNAWFKYTVFDEAAGTMTMRTYSPYAAGLKPEEKTYFDVNFMTGDGYTTVFPIDFAARFPHSDRIAELTDAGILRGDEAGLRLDDPITREEGCALLARVHAAQHGATIDAVVEAPFADIPSDAWYAPHLAYLKTAGLLSDSAAFADATVPPLLTRGYTRREFCNML